MDAYRDSSEKGTFETHIIRHDGSLMLDLGKGQGPEIISAALVVAAQPTGSEGEQALVWRVHASMTLMAAALARFFVLNPAFYQAMEANMAMLVSGRMDGGVGEQPDCGNPGCPVHGKPQPPEAAPDGPDAPDAD
jgi:hypothetical protein